MQKEGLVHKTAETTKKVAPLVAIIGALFSSSAAIALGVLSYFTADMISSKNH